MLIGTVTALTRAPTVTADRTVPYELVLLEPAAVSGAGEREDLLPSYARRLYWAGAGQDAAKLKLQLAAFWYSWIRCYS
jgi:hypothetical protein